MGRSSAVTARPRDRLVRLVDGLKRAGGRVRSLLMRDVVILASDIQASQLRLERQLNEIDQRLEYLQEGIGRVENRQVESSPQAKLSNSEFRVFSQWGEDGIIQFLLRRINVDCRTFVEFGVEDYRESNTRFLLVDRNWSGLVADCDRESIRRVQRSRFCWDYDLRAVHAFISKENVNSILEENGFIGEIGLLSIDIDGNDYWVWQAIEVINPILVIVEYNHRFGKNAAVTIPYDRNFDRSKAHPSMIYFGASLAALRLLGNQKGYAFVGCNSNGVNAFFVRKDKMPDDLRESSAEEGFVPGRFHETRDQNGRLIQMSPSAEQALLAGLPLVTVSHSACHEDVEPRNSPPER